MVAKHLSLDRVIYSINVADVLEVARSEFKVNLTAEQIKKIEDKIGDYFNWHETILMALQVELDLESVELGDDDVGVE